MTWFPSWWQISSDSLSSEIQNLRLVEGDSAVSVRTGRHGRNACRLVAVKGRGNDRGIAQKRSMVERTWDTCREERDIRYNSRSSVPHCTSLSIFAQLGFESVIDLFHSSNVLLMVAAALHSYPLFQCLKLCLPCLQRQECIGDSTEISHCSVLGGCSTNCTWEDARQKCVVKKVYRMWL